MPCPHTDGVRAVVYWLRAWSLRRGVALALVAVVAAVALGFVLLAALGARRADTAWEDLRSQARDTDVLLDAASVREARALTRDLRRVDGVAGTATTAYAYLVPKGRLEDFYGGAILPLDRRALDAVWRPVPTSGRRADPRRVDEVVVNENFVAASGRGLGDEVVLVDPFGLVRQEVRIVGVSVMPVDFTFGAGAPLAFPTPAFARRWQPELLEVEQRGGTDVLGAAVMVRGEPGTDSEELARALVRAAGARRIVAVNTVGSSSQLVVDTLEFQRNGYLALAIAAAVAGGGVLALLLARAVRLRAAEVTSLRAIGFSRRDQRRAMLGPGLLVAATGTIGAAVLVAALAGLVPTGLASQVAADRALGDDWMFVVLGALAGGAVLAGIAALVSRPSAAPVGRDRAGRVAPLRLLRWPSLAVGLRGAAGGRSRVGRAQALAGVVVVAVAVLGITAVGIVTASRSYLYDHPRLSGIVYDVDVSTYTDAALVARDRERLLASSAVTSLATIDVVAPRVDGIGIEAIVVAPQRGAAIGLPVLEGRLPSGRNEVAVTPAFLARRGKQIGDRLQIAGRSTARPFVITGTVVVPFVGASAAGEQMLMTQGGRRELALDPEGFALAVDVSDPDAVRAVSAPNDDIQACTAKLLPLLGVERLPGATAQGIGPCVTRLDQRAANLRELGAVPTLLVVFLACLGIAGIVYALGSSVRRTRHDLAVLRALGFTRPQVVTAALVQGGTVALVGAVLAVPLGVALGRAVWRATIDDIGLVERIVVPTVAVGGVVAAAVITGLLVSATPALWVARRSVTGQLRVE